jgi:hypothetical protein
MKLHTCLGGEVIKMIDQATANDYRVVAFFMVVWILIIILGVLIAFMEML